MKNMVKENQAEKRRFPWLALPTVLICVGYVVIIILAVSNPGALPADFVHSTINYLLLGVAMVLPLCMTVISGIILGRTPHVDRATKRYNKRGMTLWYRVDIPFGDTKGDCHEKK